MINLVTRKDILFHIFGTNLFTLPLHVIKKKNIFAEVFGMQLFILVCMFLNCSFTFYPELLGIIFEELIPQSCMFISLWDFIFKMSDVNMGIAKMV